MFRLVAIVMAAAIVAGASALVLVATPEVEASAPKAAVKGDRLDIKTYGANCSQTVWPYYEAGCLRNTVGSSRDARSVRLVSTDRAR